MERPVDELVRRILGACADDARGRAGRILSEAIREAEEEVKSLVKSAMKVSLLREAAGAMGAAGASPEEREEEVEEPVEPEREHDFVQGWYVYGITRSADHVARDLRGVTDAAVEVVEQDGVVAVVNRVPLEEFENALKGEAVQNLQWLEAKARGHDGVLKGLLAAGPVVPFRFCTILRSDEDVRAMLSRHRDAIVRTLTAFDGKREWGVKIAFDSARVSERGGGADGGEAGGKGYLLNKKRRRDERGEAARAARAKAVECHQQLAALAADAMTLPARRPKEFAEPMELLLNGAYLVADGALDRFRAMVDSLAERNREAGLVLEMTGPWPAYNFVRLDLSMEAAA